MTASLKGTFDPDDVNAYLAQAGRNSDDHKPPPPRFAKEELNYFYRPEFELSPTNQVVTIPKNGNARASTVAIGQCICMDVGCWTGRGIDNDRHRDEKRDHHRHREFGVVCGPVAALCCYPDPGIAKLDDSAVDRLVRAREEYKRIRSLLEKLTQEPTSDGLPKLQAVKVLQAMAVDDLRLLDANVNANDLSLHVFLGDLHLPVVGSKQTSSDRPESGQPITRWSRLDFSDEFGRVLHDFYSILENLVAPGAVAGVAGVALSVDETVQELNEAASRQLGARSGSLRRNRRHSKRERSGQRWIPEVAAR